ncbi:hypothetical protein V8C42DRAFT_353560 [Trichoderma barbatum]
MYQLYHSSGYAKKLEELHKSFALVYDKYASKIDAIWRSFDRNKRARFFVAHFKGKPVRHHRTDTSGNWGSIVIPEMSMYDISTDPNFLLNHFKHRATKSLFEQFSVGPYGGLGDGPYIIKRLKGDDFLLEVSTSCTNDYVTFKKDRYADFFEFVQNREVALKLFEPLIRTGVCVPRPIGDQIFNRQYALLMSFQIMALSVQEQRETLSVSDLISYAQDQKDSLEEYLAILSEEPIVLTHNIKTWLLTRPELTDKYIGAAIFEAVHSAIQRVTIQNYICLLLELLEDLDTDIVHKRTILQEISNVCHLEYYRAQAYFIRHIQTGIGAKYFKRVANSYDKGGNPRVVMKIKPQELTGSDIHIQYLLRLCQSQTKASLAIGWIEKLSDLYESRPNDRKCLQEGEIDSLGDLIVIATFIQELSTVVSMPALSRKTAQLFVSGSQKLYSTLNNLRRELDIQDCVVPIHKLLEPGMTKRALTMLDQFVICKTGSKMGYLYQHLVEECLAQFQNEHQKAKENPMKTDQALLPGTIGQSRDKKLEQKKQKETTLEKLFFALSKPSGTAVAINWATLEDAMRELGYSMKSRYCSVYTFGPPEAMPCKRPCTVYRPRNSQIEEHSIPILAHRLNKAYGWCIDFSPGAE